MLPPVGDYRYCSRPTRRSENRAFRTQTSRPVTGRVAGTIRWSLQVYHSICGRVQDSAELSPASIGGKKKKKIVMHLSVELLRCSVFVGRGDTGGTPAAVEPDELKDFVQKERGGGASTHTPTQRFTLRAHVQQKSHGRRLGCNGEITQTATLVTINAELCK